MQRQHVESCIHHIRMRDRQRSHVQGKWYQYCKQVHVKTSAVTKLPSDRS